MTALPQDDSPPAVQVAHADSDEDRLRYVLAAQEHCDAYLPEIADPRGKSVVVVGCGAGTEMLWALRHGAREVIGLDVAAQSPRALEQAIVAVGPERPAPWTIRRLAAEDAASLGRRFELVLSNNAFEHLADLAGAFRACAALVEPGHGRLAVFTNPLYWSAHGSHLPHEPWEHLLADPTALRARLLASLPATHPLHRLPLPAYLFEEISLNRMRLADFVAAARDAGLVPLHLGLLVDRDLAALPHHLPALLGAHPEQRPADFALAGIAAELVLLPTAGAATGGAASETRGEHEPGDGGRDATASTNGTAAPPSPGYRSTAAQRRETLVDEVLRLQAEQARLAQVAAERGADIEHLHAEVDRLTGENLDLHASRGELASVRALLADTAAAMSAVQVEVARLQAESVALHADRGELEAVREELGRATVALADRHAEVTRLQGEEARLQGTANELVTLVARRDAELAATRATLAELRTSEAALRASRSYRLGRALTAPARWLAGRLRGGDRS